MTSIIISFDFELGWGVLESSLWKEREAAGVYRRLRPIWKTFLNELDKYEIPVTIGVTTSMLEGNVNDIDLTHLPGGYQSSVRSFLQQAEFDTWNALDLFEMLMSTKIQHDIGSHSHTHIYSAHPESNEEVVTRDISRSFLTLRKNGVAAGSLIFPKDQILHRAAVNSGVRTYRIPPTKVIKTSRFLNTFYELVSPAAMSQFTILPDDLIVQSGSAFINWTTGRHSSLKRLSIKRKLESLLNRSPKAGPYHLWLHPFNLVETPGLYEYLIQWLHRCSNERERNGIRFTTMSEEAGSMLVRQSTPTGLSC